MNIRSLLAVASISRFGYADRGTVAALGACWLLSASLRFGAPGLVVVGAAALLCTDLSMPGRVAAIVAIGAGAASLATVRARALEAHEWRNDMNNMCLNLAGHRWTGWDYDHRRPPRWWWKLWGSGY